MVSKRTERRHRAKTTGAITVMLRAPRADIVAALVRGGYLVGGVVPSEKELQEAAQRHYTDSLKDGVESTAYLSGAAAAAARGEDRTESREDGGTV